MYPLSVVLVGCDANLLLALSNLPNQYPTYLEAEFADDSGARLAWTNDPQSPRLLLVVVRSNEEARQIERLHQHFPSWPVVAMVDGGVELLVRALAAGAFQVLPLPPRAEDFRAVLDAVAERFARGASATKSSLLVVCGVHQGVGATTLAMQLAQGLARDVRRLCILAELAFTAPALGKYLRVAESSTLANCFESGGVTDEVSLREALVRITGNLDGLPAPRTGQKIASSNVLELIECLPVLAQTILLDLPFTNESYFFQLLENADRVLFVGNQQVASIRALRILRRLVEIHGAELGKDYAVAINRFDPGMVGFGDADIRALLDVRELFLLPNHPAPLETLPLASLTELEPVLAWLDNDALDRSNEAISPWRWLFREWRTAPKTPAPSEPPPSSLSS